MYFDLLINKDSIIIIKGVFGAYKYGGRYYGDIRRIIDGKTKFLAISLARRPRAK